MARDGRLKRPYAAKSGQIWLGIAPISLMSEVCCARHGGQANDRGDSSKQKGEFKTADRETSAKSADNGRRYEGKTKAPG